MDAKRYDYDEESYEILQGQKHEGKIVEQKLAGFAKRSSIHNYYSFRLCMFPKNRYFLRKNRDSSNSYTIYSKFIRDGDSVQLLEPVGTGLLQDDLKDYLSLRFNLFPGIKLFLGLFPRT